MPLPGEVAAPARAEGNCRTRVSTGGTLCAVAARDRVFDASGPKVRTRAFIQDELVLSGSTVNHVSHIYARWASRPPGDDGGLIWELTRREFDGDRSLVV